MRKIAHSSLLQLLIFFVFSFNTLFTYSYASTDEDRINEIIETHGKNNVINFLLKKRNGKITIEKNRSFLNVSGKPDKTFVSVKSINHDLNIIKLDISDFEIEFDEYIQDVTKKNDERNRNLDSLASADDDEEIPLSKKLKYQISVLEFKYKKSDDEYERGQLDNELSRLRRKYKQAKYKEKYNLPSETSQDSNRKKSTYRNVSYCNNAKEKLRTRTQASYRHQIFYCNDRAYRRKNPQSCGDYKSSRKYSLKQYKDEIKKLRDNVAKSCGS
jgi:hypothetical protein